MKKIFVLIIFSLLLVVVIYINDYKSIKKTVNYNGNNLLISIDDKNSDTLPTSGVYYLTDYKCGSKSTVVKWDNEEYKLSISNGNKKAGVACSLTFKSKFLLSEASIGSYVKYSGNNGCSGKNCEGANANYIDEYDNGYCGSSDNKYITSGWRVAYVKDDSAYLISAGGLECVTRSAGVDNVILYVNDLNSKALKYCNSNFTYDGKCNNSTVHSINEEDYQFILSKSINNCINSRSDIGCGYNNDLIDNGGYYFLATSYDGNSNSVLMWNAKDRDISYGDYNNNYGLRPVIRISNTVYVKKGSGTYDNPYVIANE